jgi:hypothetical protein
MPKKMEPNDRNSCETNNVEHENMKSNTENSQHIVQTSGDDAEEKSDHASQDDGDEFDFSESDFDEDLDNEKPTDNRVDKLATNLKSESVELSLSTSGERESIDSSCPASSEDILTNNNNNNCENNNNNESDIDNNTKINKSTIDIVNSSGDTMSDKFLLNESLNTALVDQLSPNTRKSIENIADVFFEAEQQPLVSIAHNQRRRSSVLTDNYYDDASSDEDDGIINDFLGKSNDVVCVFF